jgi:YbgC/YbaW family acyl-CoA thioester hydrolase
MTPPIDATNLPADARIRTEVQVMFFDTDIAGVVHNIAYLRFIETARTLLAGALGMSLAEMARSQQYPVVVRTEIDYKRPATLGDTLVIDGWLERLERIRFWCGFTIKRQGDDDTVLIRCRQMLALVQMPAGKPIRLSEEWITRYGHLGKVQPSDEAAASRKYGGQVL